MREILTPILISTAILAGSFSSTNKADAQADSIDPGEGDGKIIPLPSEPSCDIFESVQRSVDVNMQGAINALNLIDTVEWTEENNPLFIDAISEIVEGFGENNNIVIKAIDNDNNEITLALQQRPFDQTFFEQDIRVLELYIEYTFARGLLPQMLSIHVVPNEEGKTLEELEEVYNARSFSTNEDDSVTLMYEYQRDYFNGERNVAITRMSFNFPDQPQRFQSYSRNSFFNTDTGLTSYSDITIGALPHPVTSRGCVIRNQVVEQ